MTHFTLSQYELSSQRFLIFKPRFGAENRSELVLAVSVLIMINESFTICYIVLRLRCKCIDGI